MATSYALQLCDRLAKEFPDPRTPLNWKESYQLAISVILSAQCTDERVNMVTPKLFGAFPTLQSLAVAELPQIEKEIYSTGFYKNKAKNIRGFSRQLLDQHEGVLPQSLEALLLMPGIGRKTANVILQELYNKAVGFVVDTHVQRLSGVLGLSQSKSANKIELDLMGFFPKRYWRNLSLQLIFLGRKYCTAYKRNCQACPLSDICPSSDAGTHGFRS